MDSRLRPQISLLVLSALILAACSAAPSPTASAASPSASIPVSPSASASAGRPATVFPLTATDDAHRAVVIPARPRRIVSLAPSNTEIVCAIGACSLLVGVTDFDDYPAEVASVPEVVVSAVVDVEKVVAADPDLILAAGNELTPSSVIRQLTDLGYPVLVLYPQTLDQIPAEIRHVGQVLDLAGPADDLAISVEARIAAVVAAVAGADRPRTFYEVGVFGGVIYTAGADSFLASLISLAGGDPITGDPKSTAIQLEALVAADPQLILLGDAPYDPSITPAAVAARAGWEGMTAVRGGQVIAVPDDTIISRPGPRIIDGLEELARAIHPERFP